MVNWMAVVYHTEKVNLNLGVRCAIVNMFTNVKITVRRRYLKISTFMSVFSHVRGGMIH